MSNQLITVLSTLSGAVIGFVGALITNILSNRHTTNLERLKIAEEKRKEESKRHTTSIEEAYQTLLSVDDLIVQLAYDVRNSNNRNLDALGRIKEIRSISQRMPVLIRLYLPALRKEFEEHSVNLSNYWNAIGSLFEAKKANLPQLEIKDRYDKLTQAENTYTNSLEHFRVELEKQIKGKQEDSLTR